MHETAQMDDQILTIILNLVCKQTHYACKLSKVENEGRLSSYVNEDEVVV
jgi:hypothetical protein